MKLLKHLPLLAALIVTPTLAQTVVPVQATTAPAMSLTLSTTPVALYGFEVDPGSSNGVAYVFNAASAPADGAVTPWACYTVKAGQTLAIAYTPGPIILTPGVTIVFGVDSGLTNHCFTLTKQTAAFISGSAQ